MTITEKALRLLEKRKPKWPSLKHGDLLSHKEH